MAENRGLTKVFFRTFPGNESNQVVALESGVKTEALDLHNGFFSKLR